VRALYQDYAHWPDVFPAIRATRLIRENDSTKAIEVDHATAGRVLNLMTVLSDGAIRLQEFKPRYDALFTNRIDADAAGTRFTVFADVQFKGALRLLRPFARRIVRRRIAKLLLQPLKATAESAANQ